MSEHTLPDTSADTSADTSYDALPDYPHFGGGVFELTTYSGSRTILDFDHGRSLRLPAVHPDGFKNTWSTDNRWMPLTISFGVAVGQLAYYGDLVGRENRTSRVQKIRRLSDDEVFALNDAALK